MTENQLREYGFLKELIAAQGALIFSLYFRLTPNRFHGPDGPREIPFTCITGIDVCGDHLRATVWDPFKEWEKEFRLPANLLFDESWRNRVKDLTSIELETERWRLTPRTIAKPIAPDQSGTAAAGG